MRDEWLLMHSLLWRISINVCRDFPSELDGVKIVVPKHTQKASGAILQLNMTIVTYEYRVGSRYISGAGKESNTVKSC